MITAEFVKTIYPKAKQVSTSGYMVCEYRSCADLSEPRTIKKGELFTAFGYFLPTAKVNYNLDGSWEKGKYGVQFKVKQVTNADPTDITSVLNYLSSGLISGIGPKTAERICDRFGVDSLKIIESEPEKLLKIKGITEARLQKIVDSYSKTKGTSELVGYLSPLGVPPNKIMKIYNKFKSEALTVAKEHPFRLCSIPGISYIFASSLADMQGLPKDSPERCQAALMYILEQNEVSGNLFMYVNDWLAAAYKLIDCPSVTIDTIRGYGLGLVKSLDVKYTINPENENQKVVYRMAAAKAENKAAAEVLRVLNYKCPEKDFNVTESVDEYEERKHIELAPEQRAAVENVLSHKVSIITGGPGTGKTTVIGALYDIYKGKNEDAKVLLCAPTGTAARKMAAATGVAAYTIHKAIGMNIAEEGEMENMDLSNTLDVDFVIVDEYSMADVYLTASLFSALPSEARIVLLGDVDQLPSVGPGSVLSEFISSSCIPISRLIKIYRQKSGSKVAINAAIMRVGRTDLQYDDESFVFIPANTPEESAEKIKSLYLDETAVNGVDNVTMLSPFKRKTASCSNELNNAIHNLINPPNAYKAELIVNGTVYRVGDKVMQTKNKDNVSNGDIGYITKINTAATEITVDFGFQVVEYTISDLEMLEHAYATSVHKSQGAEYEVVIINLLNTHKIMLWRNLIYTAITRAKRKVIIVGQKDAIETAIKNSTNKECKRNTLLAVRLRFLS